MALCVLVFVLLVACDRTPTAAIAPVPAASTVAPVTAVGAVDAGPDAADVCADIRARFNAALATRTDACSKPSDCGCYNPVGGAELGCGGVTDSTTVAKLTPIEKEFHAAKCAWGQNCAGWVCAPKCVSGKCTR